MPTTSKRMLQLLALLQSGARRTGSELSERLGVSARTLRRDIASLRELGYSVDVGLGPSGSYALVSGTTLPPLILDDKQAVAIAIALQAAPESVIGLGDAARTALSNVRRLLPARLAPHLDALTFTSIRNSWELAAPPIDGDVLLALGRAQAGREIVRVTHEVWPPVAGEAGMRRLRIEPHHLIVWSARWYLVGYDTESELWIVLRADRITGLSNTRLPFVPRAVPGGDVATFIQENGDRGDAPDHWPCVGEVTLHLAAPLVARWAPGGAVVRPIDDERCAITIGAWSWTGLAALIGTFAADFDSVSPAELRNACHRLAVRYSRITVHSEASEDAENRSA